MRTAFTMGGEVMNKTRRWGALSVCFLSLLFVNPAGAAIVYVRQMNLKIIGLVALLFLYTPFAYANNIWVDWTTGATQPFINSSGDSGTVSYTHTLTTASPNSRVSPDILFPFTNPINYLRSDHQPFSNPDGWIEFTFSGVSPDTQSLFTAGNLRPTNRFLISAFDAVNVPISLVTWTNHGDYLLFATDTGPNLWDPLTGVVTGDGIVQNQDNSKNIFFGLTGDIARIRVDFENVDGGAYDVLTFGLAGGGVAIPDPPTLWLFSCGLVGLIGISRAKKTVQ